MAQISRSFVDNEDSPEPVVSGTNDYEGGTFTWAPAEGEDENTQFKYKPLRSNK